MDMKLQIAIACFLIWLGGRSAHVYAEKKHRKRHSFWALLGATFLSLTLVYLGVMWIGVIFAELGGFGP